MKKLTYICLCLALVCASLVSCANPLTSLKERIHGPLFHSEEVMTQNVPDSAFTTEVVSTPKKEEFDYSKSTDGDGNVSIVLNKYNGSDVNVIIPSELDEGSFTAIGKAAFSDNGAIYNVTVPGGVRLVDNYAFFGCENLQIVSLPQSVKKIGVEAFANCSSMVELHLPTDVSSVGESCFAYCTSLVSAGLPTALKIIPARAFEGCEKLVYIYIPKAVERIESKAFKGCYALTKVDISENVTHIADDAFDGCESVRIACHPGSYAEAFAKQHGFEILNLGEDAQGE